jgi:pimeloyl-ACP methyl ester carboxylesterase
MLGSLLALAACVLVAGAAAAQPAPVTTRIVGTGNDAIEVLEQGAGPIVVMLPSLGRGAEDFNQLAAMVSARGLRVIRPQPRGIGRSAPAKPDATLHDYAADVARVIEAEGQGPVVVAGHAFGNFVARMLATDRPDLVRGVILLAASAGKVPKGVTEPPIAPDIRAAIERSADFELPVPERLEALSLAFFAPGHDPSVWLDGWHLDVLRAETAAQRRGTVDDFFAAGHAPILDVQASDDTIAPRKFASVLRDALGSRVETVVIADAGHALIPEQPERVADAIVPWVKARQ